MTPQQQFFTTRPSSNTGAKMMLRDPRTGGETDHYLHVLGCDSDAFRTARLDGQRAGVKLPKGISPEEKDKFISDQKLNMLASVVTGWSFDVEPSKDNVKDFLREAPSVADDVDKFCSDLSNFLPSSSSDSMTTVGETSA